MLGSARICRPPAAVTNLKASLLNWFIVFAVFGAFAFAPDCGSAAPASEEMSFKLSSAEIASARNLAERALAEKRFAQAYFVQAEIARDKSAEAEGRLERKALVTHYQTDGDLTILTTVNLDKNATESVETVAHLPTPLSEEEFKLAQTMGLADPKVKEALGQDIEKVKVEALVLRTMSPKDPIFGHRVVSLLFRVEKNYLSEPSVMVDLTTKKVTIEKSKR